MPVPEPTPRPDATSGPEPTPRPDPTSGPEPTPRPDPILRRAVARRVAESAPADRAGLRREVARALAAEGVVAAPARWAALVRDLVDDLGGLGPLEPLLRDPQVTDVLVNGADDVHVERAGLLHRVDVAFEDDDAVLAAIRRALGPLGVRLDRRRPWADAVLEGGVRLHAVTPPLTERPSLTLRRVAPVAPTWDELVEAGFLPPDLADRLRAAVRDRRNLVVSGRAGVGKTTLLARLVAEIGADRAVVIEDAPELRAPGVHAVALRTRPASPEGDDEVTLADLVRNALRMRPDRLVVGEVRGREVADMLQAMNTGHAGSMTTVHANHAADAVTRLEGMALLAGLPLEAVRAQLASGLDLVIGLDRDRDGRRRVGALVEVSGGAAQVRIRQEWP